MLYVQYIRNADSLLHMSTVDITLHIRYAFCRPTI